MTYVTAGRAYGKLLARFEFGFQGLEIGDNNAAAFDLEQPFGLKAGKISRDQFANRANLRGQLLVVSGQCNSNTAGRRLSGSFRQSHKECCQPIANCGKGKFFDDPDQPPQSCPHNPQNFKSNLWMRQTERLKVRLADEEKCCVIHCGHRCGIVATIKYWKFCDGTPRTFDAENMLSSAGGTLENPDMA